MFKYNYRILLPFITLFIVCLLFIFINKNKLTYNSKIIKQNSSENINICNKKKKNLNIIPSTKKNNNKILDYVFENLTIETTPVVTNTNKNANFSLSKNEYNNLQDELKTLNEDNIKSNEHALQGYNNEKRSITDSLWMNIKKLAELKNQQAKNAIKKAVTDKVAADKAATDVAAAAAAAAANKAAADKAAADKVKICSDLIKNGSYSFDNSFWKESCSDINLEKGGCFTVKTEQECRRSIDGRDDFKGQQCVVVEPQNGAEERDKESICQPKDWTINQGENKFIIVD